MMIDILFSGVSEKKIKLVGLLINKNDF